MTIRFSVPFSLGMPRVLDTVAALRALPDATEYELDFSQTQHFEPFGMLLVGSAIRRLQERAQAGGTPPQVSILGKDLELQGHNYAQRLGFWWSIGDDEDIPSVKRTASAATIPVTRLSYAELFKEAGSRDPIRANLVSKAAGELATTLSGGSATTVLWIALEYCFREMIRNAFEHGRTDSVWYTGATRRGKGDVQIAILDAGRGIRDSLSDNPDERHLTDAAALRASLRAGVSRNTHRHRSQELTEKLLDEFPGQDPSFYDNSGFGLTVTSHIGREAGQFAIVSGSTSLAFFRGTEVSSTTWHAGTAVRIVLHPDRIDKALNGTPLKGDGPFPRMSASMLARLGLDRVLGDRKQ